MWIQKEINLRPRERGFHLITEEVESSIREIRQIRAGLLNIFIKHTSASLTINENADPTVRADFEQYFNHVAPENEPYYQHIFEGSDDAPAHFKNSILGSSIQIPITNGKLNLGTWQGIYLGEHRNHGGSRTIVITLCGE
ncbi:secondary thiamine-phosphate synthase enzyme YjbQ [Vibrio alginolyticus]|uniref:secondary thiamine-phosphate synthase enzyme YjbQ n=1 Tax=Vibrio alginolyticus TaxID=663 RepID=UPI003754317F